MARICGSAGCSKEVALSHHLLCPECHRQDRRQPANVCQVCGISVRDSRNDLCRRCHENLYDGQQPLREDLPVVAAKIVRGVHSDITDDPRFSEEMAEAHQACFFEKRYQVAVKIIRRLEMRREFDERCCWLETALGNLPEPYWGNFPNLIRRLRQLIEQGRLAEAMIQEKGFTRDFRAAVKFYETHIKGRGQNGNESHSNGSSHSDKARRENARVARLIIRSNSGIPI